MHTLCLPPTTTPPSSSAHSTLPCALCTSSAEPKRQTWTPLATAMRHASEDPHDAFPPANNFAWPAEDRRHDSRAQIPDASRRCRRTMSTHLRPTMDAAGGRARARRSRRTRAGRIRGKVPAVSTTILRKGRRLRSRRMSWPCWAQAGNSACLTHSRRRRGLSDSSMNQF